MTLVKILKNNKTGEYGIQHQYYEEMEGNITKLLSKGEIITCKSLEEARKIKDELDQNNWEEIE